MSSKSLNFDMEKTGSCIHQLWNQAGVSSCSTRMRLHESREPGGRHTNRDSEGDPGWTHKKDIWRSRRSPGSRSRIELHGTTYPGDPGIPSYLGAIPSCAA